jgi:hypothetical protein
MIILIIIALPLIARTQIIIKSIIITGESEEASGI